jgi:formyltetrahydrofolate deformylase
MYMQRVVVLVVCPDGPGIVARVTSLLAESGWNILSLEQHVERPMFFMRVFAENQGDSLGATRGSLQKLATGLKGDITLYDPAERQKIGLLVTKEPACPLEILSRAQAGELNGEVSVMIGNEPDLQQRAEQSAVSFHHVPSGKKAEGQMQQLLDEAGVQLVVLARYMKVLSADFIRHFEGRVINIHHSFLPSFPGARPYHRAWERGVKVIGATAHYATEELDEGPIIAQDVASVSHQHSVEMLKETGAEIERRVLYSAVKAHLEHRVLVHNGRTIVFHPDGQTTAKPDTQEGS